MEERKYLVKHYNEYVICKETPRTRATTAIRSFQAERSTCETCWRFDLTSSSTRLMSLVTLFTANWASCFAAVVLTEVEDPVSRSSRSLSNLDPLRSIPERAW